MKLKNIFFLGMLVLILALVFIGCAGNDSETYIGFRIALTEAQYKAHFNGFLNYDILNDDEYTLLSGEGLLTATENAFSVADTRKVRYTKLELSEIQDDLNMPIFNLTGTEINAFLSALANNNIAVYVFKFTSGSASAFNTGLPDESKVNTGEVLIYTAAKE